MCPQCAYCSKPSTELTAEHPLPRSIGDDTWTIPACRTYNRRANRLIDDQLRHCPYLQEVRAKSGLVQRNGERYAFELIGDPRAIL